MVSFRGAAHFGFDDTHGVGCRQLDTLLSKRHGGRGRREKKLYVVTLTGISVVRHTPVDAPVHVRSWTPAVRDSEIPQVLAITFA